ncbi:hypothetical protein V3N99_09145 [Dermatophilaceae bacterium Soc4.6]
MACDAAVALALARHGRRVPLHIKDTALWVDVVLGGHSRLLELMVST